MGFQAAFLFDASPRLGAGHAMRCLALADRLAAFGWKCTLVTPAEARRTVPAVERAGHALALPDSWDGGADLVVIDDYRRGSADEAGLRAAGRRILAIDDLADRAHDCDILLDQTHGRGADDYRALVPAGCQVLTGAAMALLRPEFLRRRAEAQARRATGVPPGRILISLGATDPVNATAAALAAAAIAFPHAKLDVVLGGSAPFLAELRARVAALGPRAALHVDTDAMADLMVAADLAIGAAGSSAWERCVLALPTVMIVTADNQRLVAANLARTGAAVLAGAHDALTVAGLADILGALTPPSLAEMSRRAGEVCDGRGAQRLLCALAGTAVGRDGRPVTLRLAGPGDVMTVLEWQRHPETRRFARNPAIPDEMSHRRWMAAKLADPDTFFCIVQHGEDPAGMVRLDRADGTSPTFEVSIFTAPERYGLGVGQAALALLDRACGGALLVAEVLAGNDASMRLFQRAGYTAIRTGLFHRLPLSC